MTGQTSDGVTHILQRLSEGNPGSFEQLIDAVYGEIRAIAHNRRAGRFGDQAALLTEQTTQLAHQVLMEFERQRSTPTNTEHFFAIATRLLMHRLTDYQRARMAQARGGGNRGAGNADEVGAHEDTQLDQAEQVQLALQRLHASDARKAEVVTLHLWRGLSLPQIADRLEVSLPTVERDWRAAKAWLASELGSDE